MNPRIVAEIRPDRGWIGAPAARGIANPTVALFLGSLAVIAAMTVAYVEGLIAWYAVVPVNMLAIYVIFTPLHEATHGIAHASRTWNAVIGRVSGLALATSFPFFRAVHLEHHSHTNDPERDPDFLVAKSPRFLLPLWCLLVESEYRRHFYGRRLWRAPADRYEAMATDAVLLGAIIASIALGFWRPLLVCWIGPATLAFVMLAFLFDFVPHYPYDSRGRYFDTRIYPGRLLNALLLGQNHHLIHHLWTTIPWFRYQPVFGEIRDQLEARGARIGWTVGPLPADVERIEAA